MSRTGVTDGNVFCAIIDGTGVDVNIRPLAIVLIVEMVELRSRVVEDNTGKAAADVIDVTDGIDIAAGGMPLLKYGIGNGDVNLVGVVNKFNPLSALTSDSLVRVRDVFMFKFEEPEVGSNILAIFWA